MTSAGPSCARSIFRRAARSAEAIDANQVAAAVMTEAGEGWFGTAMAAKEARLAVAARATAVNGDDTRLASMADPDAAFTGPMTSSAPRPGTRRRRGRLTGWRQRGSRWGTRSVSAASGCGGVRTSAAMPAATRHAAAPVSSAALVPPALVIAPSMTDPIGVVPI